MLMILHNHQYAQTMKDDFGEINQQINKVKQEELDAFVGLNIEVQNVDQSNEMRTQTTTRLPPVKSNSDEMEWLELFKKKSGGSDWTDVLMQNLGNVNESPETVQVEDTFEKLTEWKSSPYKIVDQDAILDMIKE